MELEPEPELFKSRNRNRNRNHNFFKSRNRNHNFSKVRTGTGTVKNSYGSTTLHSSRACAAFVRFCLPELCSAPLLVCSLQEFCAAPGRVCLQESSVCYTWRNTVYKFFLFVSVCFETVLFVSIVSICVRNTETNRKTVFLISRNKPKNNRNRLCFGSFRFKPKIYFICFEDTLRLQLTIHPNAIFFSLSFILKRTQVH
jgi:hypothetical protein